MIIISCYGHMELVPIHRMGVNLIVNKRVPGDNFLIKLNKNLNNLSIDIYSKYVIPKGIFNFF